MPFTLVLLTAVLVVLPWSRTVGVVFALLLFVPAIVVWVRARDLTDGSRGLTTATMIIGCLVFVVGLALGSESSPSPSSVPPGGALAPVVPATGQAEPAQQPRVHASSPTVTRAPRVAPPRATHAPPPAATSDGSAYYKNCDAARAAGVAPLHTGDSGYRAALDRDSDGIACE